MPKQGLKYHYILLLCLVAHLNWAAHLTDKVVHKIPAPRTANINVTVTDETCTNADDGVIDFVIDNFQSTTVGSNVRVVYYNNTGSSSGFQDITLTSSGTISGSFTGIVPSDYLIQFLTGTSETGTSSMFTVAEGGASFQFNPTLPTCNGNSDGSVTITASGGVAPYVYSLGSGRFQSSNSFQGLSAGSYSFNIRDASGCVTTESFTLNEPDQLTATLTPTSPSCTSGQTSLVPNSDSDGSIAIQASGGTTPYTYSIDGGTTFVSNATLSGLTAGNYSVTIQDANGCQITENVTITPPIPITASLISSTNISCFGQQDGTITLNATGGTGTYAVLMTDVNTNASNFLTMVPNTPISNVTAGTYDLLVADSKNCQVSNTIRVVITAPSDPLEANSRVDTNSTGGSTTSAGGTLTSTFCAGSTVDITVSATAGGGTLPYEYSLDGINYVSNPVFSNVGPGVYSAYVRDANGCIDNTALTRTIVIADPIAFSLASTDVTCFGGSDGTITVSSVTGGLSGTTYSIDGVNFQNTPLFDNLASGTYTITVNAGNCFSTMTATVNEPATVTAVANILSNVNCNGQSNGIAEIILSGATSPVKYSIGTGNLQNSNVYTGLAAGSYTVTATYGPDDCTISTNFSITEPATTVASSFTQTDVICNGEATGSFTVTASGGTAPYQYFLDGQTPQPSNEFTGLTAGTYNYFVIDANNCASPGTVFITEPSPINISFLPTAPSCIGNSDGMIQINLANGGTAPIQIRLQGTTTTASSIGNLAPGDYDVEAVDANGCIVTNMVTVPEASPLTADVTIDSNASGCGNSDGAFTLSNPRKGNQNIPNVEYSIDGGTTYQSSASFTGLAAGVYTVDIRDISGSHLGTGNCNGQVSVTITEPSGITGNITATGLDCNGDTNGTLTVSGVTGGTGPYEYSLDGTTFVSSGAFTGLSGGTYNVTIRDASSCTTSLTATIAEPSAITASLSVTDIFCNGAADGEIAVIASGGTGSLEFSIDGTNFQPSNRFDGLDAGSYTLTIRDDNGCNIQVQGTVTEPTAISASFTATTNVTCNGGTDGTATIAVSGGTSPYEVSIDGTQFFPVPPNGLFDQIGAIEIPTVLVRDANGCEISIPGFTITEPAPLAADLGITQVTCNGNGDGTITVTPTSTTTNSFEYAIDGTNFSANATFSQLTPGQYTITMRKTGTNCSNTFNATITEPDVLEGFVTVVNLSCSDSQDGQLQNTATGGTAPYEYSLDGTNFQTTDFSGLATGAYTVTVRDANGCTATKNVNIVAPDALLIEASQVTDASCNGGSDGSALVNASGGTMPYTYSMNGTDFSSSIDLTQLSADSYTITVKDAQDCESTVSFTIAEPAAIIATVSSMTNISCNGGTDGSLTVTASAGQGGFTYAIDGTTFGSSSTFSNLAAGSYTITIMDASGCTTSVTQSLTEPDALNLQFEAVDITCFGANDGQIAGIATGGTAPYTYSLDGTNFQGTAFSGLTAGSYTLTVRDDNDCETTQTVQIAEPAALAASLGSSSNASCNGATDGSLTITATGGSTPYTYSIDGTTFGTASSFTNLGAGSYTVTVSDANNCTTTTTATLTEPDALSASATGATLLCNGNADGSISATATGGTSPYEYALDGSTFQSSNSFSALMAGSYTITIRDANGCTTTATAGVTEPDAISASSSVTNATCNGDASGAIDIVALGGTGSLEYSLDGSTFQAGPAFSGLAAGMYTITVRDANSCTVTTTATVTEPAAIVVNAAVSDLNCHGDASGALAVNASGGTGALEYSLDGTNFQASADFSGLEADSYTITVRDANSCTATVMATISEPAAITVSNAVTDATCKGEADGSISITTTGGTGAFEYSLDGTTFQSGNSFSGLAADSYTVTVRDVNGCTATAMATVGEPTAITLNTAVTDATCNGGTDGTISITASGGTGAFEYSLDGTTFQSGDGFNNLAADSYTVTVRDTNGCTATAMATVAEPAAITVTASISNDNTITATAAGGTAPYEFSIDGTTFQSSGTFSGLSNGDYTITARDANGCTSSTSQSLIITSTDGPFASATVSIYPNPSTDFIKITGLEWGDKIRVINPAGKAMKLVEVVTHDNELEMSVSGYHEGIYIIAVNNKAGQRKSTSKLMIVK